MISGFSLYMLIDPRTSQIRYVGYSKDSQMRFYSHLHDKNSKSPKANWIKYLKKQKMLPRMQVIAVLDSVEEAKRLEIILISRKKGLLNSSGGGEGTESTSVLDRRRWFNRKSPTSPNMRGQSTIKKRRSAPEYLKSKHFLGRQDELWLSRSYL